MWLGQGLKRALKAHVPLVLEDFFSPFLGAPVYPSLPIDFQSKTGKHFATLLKNLFLTLKEGEKATENPYSQVQDTSLECCLLPD